ncbi:hypothetical protein [Streptomyces sp. NPDC001985]|uniref:hypothetical protein n=1 Tax=Streptomyces sp. NPDC001985 TaxID=3154406 RepID=UPI00331F2E70
MARVYATAAQYETYTGVAAPTDIDRLLADACRMIGSRVFRLCWYEVDPDGYPENALVRAAFTNAVCAQAKWAADTGDAVGPEMVGWTVVELGSAKMARTADAARADAAPGEQIAPAVWDALRAPDLTPDILIIGLVAS